MTSNSYPPTPLQEAKDLLHAKQPEQATQVLITYLKTNPDSEEAWFLLSYAIPDRDKKIKSLERALQINPDHNRAQERLQKLQSPSKYQSTIGTQSPSAKTKGKSNTVRNILVGFIVLTILGVCIFGGWLVTQSLDLILPVNSPPEVAQHPETQPTSTPTPEASPTIISTSTPVPTITPTPTPQLTELIPTMISEFALPVDEHAQQMDDIQNQVSTLRGLAILEDSPRYLIPKSNVNEFLTNMFLERYERYMVADEVRVLSVLGLVDPTFDLFSQTVRNIGEGLGGFYVPWSDELFVIGEDFTGVEKYIFAHEYDHALTDQHYHLEQVGVYPECLNDTDRCSAISALVEGDATEIMYQWLGAYASKQDVLEIDEDQYAPYDRVITSHDIAKPYVIREIYFEYIDGQKFVKHLLDIGGWDQVNAAYQDLPQTTEQILHPEKYISQEGPIQVDLKPLEGVLDDGWRLLTTETLGELTTQMILGFHEHVLVQLDYETAEKAAAGWGGDRYQVLYKGTTNKTILVVNWVWDNDSEATEFWDAMYTYQVKRYMNNAVDHSDYDCWAKLNDHYSCIYQTGNQTLWLIAPTMDLINTLLDQYSEFK